ncbi:hypothetical protein HRF87_10230 [Bacillus sp. CRN 9]|nr:hypothetical protein [Bacillus sp. CRN 9]
MDKEEPEIIETDTEERENEDINESESVDEDVDEDIEVEATEAPSEEEIKKTNEKLLLQDYERIVNESGEYITNIQPVTFEDTYSVIYAWVPNGFKNISDNEKQSLVDHFGPSIQGVTRAYAYSGDSDIKIDVYFWYDDDSRLADPKALSDSWKIKN